MRRGAIVLCGGRSSRMGLPKATLPFGPELMLARVVRLVSGEVERIVVVAAPDQELPSLAAGISIVRDRREGRGPLEGLAAGLAALQDHADAAYVTSCDVPLLAPEFVARMFELLGEHEIVVPKDDEFHHPLAAVYRVSILPRVEALLAADRLRPFFLFQESDTREVPVAELRCVDSELASLENCNHPADYLRALAQVGFTAPAEIFMRLTAKVDRHRH
jgi:molybdenum cofactor guanylyltransferase